MACSASEVSDKAKAAGPIESSSLTLNGSLTLLLIATAENQPLWIHRRKVLCSFEAQSDIGSYDDDGLACEVDVLYRGYLPPLTLDVLENTESSHANRSDTTKKGGVFTRRLWSSDAR